MTKAFLDNIKSNTSYLLWGIIALCLCFAPLFFNFIWGNHDWLPIITDNHLSAGLIEGRFSQYLFLNLILMGKILPILNIFIGFAAYTAALIILFCYFFKFHLSKIVTTLFLITVLTLPYITEILYFHFITFSLLSWPLCIAISLVFTTKATHHPILNISISAILLFLAIGGYPPSVGLYITAACLKLIQNTTTTPPTIKDFIKSTFPYLATILIASTPIIPIYKFLQENHLMMSLYNNDITTPIELLQKIPATLVQTLQNFIQPQPYFSLSFKLLTSLIVLIFLTKYIIFSFQKHHLCLSILLIFALFLSLKFAALISTQSADNYFASYDPAMFMVRLDFYTFPCLILFSLSYIYPQSSPLLKNLIYTLSVVLLWLNLNANLSFTKTQLLGFSAENKFIDRTISRIQDHPNFNTNTYYTVLQVGDISLRKRYYTSSLFEKYGYYTLDVPFTRYWVPAEYYNFYTPQEFVISGSSINPTNLSIKMIDFLSNRIDVWPNPNALYVDTPYIIISLTKQGNELLTNQFKTIIGK